jgi:hypothetical protein
LHAISIAYAHNEVKLFIALINNWNIKGMKKKLLFASLPCGQANTTIGSRTVADKAVINLEQLVCGCPARLAGDSRKYGTPRQRVPHPVFKEEITKDNWELSQLPFNANGVAIS